MRQSFEVIACKLDAAIMATAKLARDHRDTPMAGRSNLQQAVPITFGFKMARLLATLRRHKQRLAELRPAWRCSSSAAPADIGLVGRQRVGRASSPGGRLGLTQPDIAWHTERDRIAEAGCFLGLLTGTLGKFATDLKLMMQTEVGEASEPFVPNRGSPPPCRRSATQSPASTSRPARHRCDRTWQRCLTR